MKLEYQSKSLRYGADGQPSKAQINLGNAEGAVYPVFLSPDVIEKSDSELYELALDEIYNQNFPQRAENEKFNIMGEKIAQFDEMMDKMQKALDESEKMIQTVSMTVNEIIFNNDEDTTEIEE
ncbi:DUF1366 domain-containing protein [Streptococcus sp. NLN64]|uniref:DUF1366 domain-containing protein n=1 Tax=Streptococcus sp. NLN64 TaxID=2822799 RepID=UPI0018C99B1B|nr:DUF1366 domain-containing protein [Streptococcus sp. NLN64]MBG9366564.1 DUF1366 domain-containing protein [Streptococcus sp. NLN64]